MDDFGDERAARGSLPTHNNRKIFAVARRRFRSQQLCLQPAATDRHSPLTLTLVHIKDKIARIHSHVRRGGRSEEKT